jgi:ABC-type multidrug transport system ATPase subunit
VLIREDCDGYVLKDLKSHNGTYVNGKRIRSIAVSPGTPVIFGPCAFPWEKLESGLYSRHRWITVGKHFQNDIVIDHPKVSRYHLTVRQQGDRFFVLDLNSTNGTFVNRDPIQWTHIEFSDELMLGDHVLSFETLGSVRHSEVHAEGTVIETMPVSLKKKVITVGRTTDNDVVIDHPQVSRHHARFVQQGSSYLIEDLNSSNGIFLNGRRIKKPEPVGPMDQIKIGAFLLKIDMDNLTKATFRGSTILQADNVVRAVKTPTGSKILLDHISLTIYSNELVALMGPAGAGKTTLMMCMNGYSHPTQGHARINGLDIYRYYESFRGNIGYVPQDDIIHKELTVYQALYYTAKLRLPADTNDSEINSRIGRLLSELDIEDVRNVIIGDGSPDLKGISGGQRKRVNLCLELLTEPDILFLDEPTSGLDHINTRYVMHILRRLADAGRAVVLTIHQPAEEFYQLTDNLILLDRGGKLAYYGSSSEASHYFETQCSIPSEDINPAEYVFEALKESNDPDFYQQAFRASEVHRSYVEERKTVPQQSGAPQTFKRRVSRRPGLQQWWTLTRRYFRVKLRDRSNMAIMLIQAPLVGLLIALAFGSGERPDPTKALFFLVISAIWFGCSNAAREIVAERSIYHRERMINLKIPSYVMSKLGLLAVFSVFQCFVLVGVPYWFVGLSGETGNFLKVVGILSFASLGGLSLGLVLSSVVRSNEAAIALVPIVMIPQIILGGAILPFQDMGEATKGVAGLMFSRWGFEAAMIVENPETIETVRIPTLSPPSEHAGTMQPIGMGQPDSVDATSSGQRQIGLRWIERDTTVQWVHEMGIDDENMEVDLLSLGILGVTFTLLVFAMLRLKDLQ